MAKDFFSGMDERYAIEPQEQAAENIKAASVSERDPMAEGQLRDTSKQLGYDAATLRGQSKLAIERAKQQKRIDDLTSKRDTAKWLAESPDNALISMDDIDQLERLIHVTRTVSMYKEEEDDGSASGFWNRTGATIGDIGTQFVGGIGGLMNSMYGGARFVLESDAAIARTVGLDGLADFLQRGVEFTQKGTDIASELVPTLAANAFGGTPEDFRLAHKIQDRMNRSRFDIYGISVGDVGGAGVSLIPTLLGGALFKGLEGAALLRAQGVLAGTQQASSEFGRQRAGGKDFGESSSTAAMSGLITGLLTRVIAGGPETAMDDLARKLASSESPRELFRANLVRATSVQFVSEFLEEGLDEGLQALLVDGATMDEAIDRALKGGIIGGILGGTAGLSTEMYANRVQTARTALGFRDGLEAVSIEMDQSLTVERSSDAAKTLLQSHGNLNKTVYLDGLAAQEIAKTKEGRAALYKAGVTDEDIKTAVAGKDVLELDTASIMASSKGAVRSNILDNLRQEADAPNSVEAEIFTGESNITARLAQQDEDHELAISKGISEEAKRLKKELTKATGASKEQVDAQIQKLVAFAQTMFRRNARAFKDPVGFLKKIQIQKGDGVPRGTKQTGIDAPAQFNQSGMRKTDTPEFKAFFGDSKVVDADGEPLVVYHGTDNSFDEFNLSKAGSSTDTGVWGRGFYFSSSRKYAATYNKGRNDNIIAAYVSLKNPFIINGDNIPQIDVPSETMEDLENSAVNYSQKFRDTLVDQGYDGVISGSEYVAFFPEQIKSVDNRGTFDPKDPNIFNQSIIGQKELGDTFDSRQEYYQNQFDEARGSLQITDDAYIISLFKKQDLSTVLHETGHIFLEEMRQILSTGEASEQLMRDWIAQSKWQASNKNMHIKYLRRELKSAKDDDRREKMRQSLEWVENASDAELEVAASQFGHGLPDAIAYGYAESMHEMWARGYESYLSEGKAPSLGLERAFSRFTEWIAGVYAKVKGTFNPEHDLDVILNDDVRKVFDRILATDAEIKQLMLFNEYTNRGDSEFGDIAGFDPEAAGKINGLFKEAQSELRSDILKDRTKRANVRRKEFRADLEASPVYRAWGQIRNGGGLNPVRVAGEFGAIVVDQLKKKGLIATRGSVEKAKSGQDEFSFDIASLEADSEAITTFEDPSVYAESKKKSRSGIKYAALDEYTIINKIDDLGGIAKAPKVKTPEYDDLVDLKGSNAKKIYVSTGGVAPDEMARQLGESGIGDGSVVTMWRMIDEDATNRAENRSKLKESKAVAKEQAENIGMIPDVVASQNGFEDTQDMIDGLLAKQHPFKEAQLEMERAVMDDEISAPTMEHVLDSPSYNRAITEIAKALDQALKGGIPAVERSIIKKDAEKAIANMLVYDATRVNKYLGSMHRHFKENRRALARKKYPEASKELEAGIVNMEKARASRDVRTLQNKLIASVNRWKKINPKSIDYNYHYHAMKLAEYFGLTGPVNMPPPEMGVIETLTKDANEGLVDPLPDFETWMYLPDGSQRVSEMAKQLEARRPQAGKRGPKQLFQMMEAWELDRIDEFLRMMIQRGKNKADPIIATTGESLAGWYEDWARIAGNLDDNGIPRWEKDGFAAKISNIYNEILDSAATPDHFYRSLDNQSGRMQDFDVTRPMARVFMRGSAEATNKQEALKRETYAVLEPHFRVIGQGLKRIKALHGNSVKIDGVPLPQKAKDAGVKSWRPDRLLEIVFNMGNSYNMESTANGFGWTKVLEDGSIVPDVAPMYKIAEFFTKEELRAVQGVWDGLNTLWAPSRLAHMHLYGKPPSKVDAESVTLRGMDGEITLAGGYFPLSYDRDDVTNNQMSQEAEQNLSMNIQDTFAPPKMSLGSLKERTNSGGKLINLNPQEVINKHIHSTTSFIAIAPWIEDVKRVMNYKPSKDEPTVLEIMRRKIGPSAVKQLITNMRAMAGNEKFDLTWFGKAVQVSRPAVAISLLGFNIRGPLAVADAIPTLMNDVGEVAYLRELNLFKSEEGMAMYNFILEKSQFMRRRLKGAWDRDVREVFVKEIGFDKFGAVRSARDKIADSSMALYSYPAMAYEMPAWAAKFKQTLEQTGDEDASIAAADLAIRSTQPSSDTRDQSMLLRNKTGVVAAMTMFTGWALTRLSSNRYAWRQYRADQLSLGRYASFFFFQNILSAAPFIALAALADAFGDDEDKRKKKDKKSLAQIVAKGAFVDYFHGLPLISNVTEAVYESLVEGQRFDISSASTAKSMSVMFRIVGNGINGMYDAFAEEDPKKRKDALWDVAHLMSFSLKIPVTRAMEKLTDQLERLDN